MKIGLYFGSFNPIHVGHLQVAEYIRQNGEFDEVWFVPSPLNPHKKEESLIPAELRLKWVRKAISDTPFMKCSDEEFQFGLPSFTYRSVTHFKELFPENQFQIIMGADNLLTFHTWQNAEKLAQMCPLHVYARPGFPKPDGEMPFGATWYDAPLIDISATQIRQLLENQESIDHLVPNAIVEELSDFFNVLEPTGN
jgi:nicotinate-nucleotide adenylyltransferase